MKKLLTIAFLLIFSTWLFGCARPEVRTDLKSLNENPEKFEKANVILVTEMSALLANPDAYHKKKVEVTGYVNYDRLLPQTDWGFMLKDAQENSLLCYEHEYRYYPSRSAVMVLIQAEKNHEPLTVVGVFGKSMKIELDRIEYQGRRIDTNFNYRPVLSPAQGTFPIRMRH